MIQQERVNLLAETIARHTRLILKVRKMAFPPKTIFPKRGDYRKRRAASSSAQIDILFLPALAASSIAQIIACPPDSEMSPIEVISL